MASSKTKYSLKKKGVVAIIATLSFFFEPVDKLLIIWRFKIFWCGKLLIS
jgi:hypothetical protein